MGNEVKLVLHGGLEIYSELKKSMSVRAETSNTVKDLLVSLRVDPGMVGLILIDGQPGSLASEVGNGTEIQFFPLLGGG